jgi:hypothetical protein
MVSNSSNKFSRVRLRANWQFRAELCLNYKGVIKLKFIVTMDAQRVSPQQLIAVYDGNLGGKETRAKERTNKHLTGLTRLICVNHFLASKKVTQHQKENKKKNIHYGHLPRRREAKSQEEDKSQRKEGKRVIALSENERNLI